MKRFVVTRLTKAVPVLFQVLVIIGWLFLGTAPALAATTTSLVTLGTRPSVTQKFILIKPDQPVGAVILFAGGNGVLNLSLDVGGTPVIGSLSGNFLVRTRQAYVDRGFMVAVVDAPSDYQGTNGMLGGFRATSEHAQDIAAVVAHMQSQANLPVWLIGTSRGTESAANNAIRLTQGIAGLVLTSSMSVPNANGTTPLQMNLAAIQVPSFVLHHDQDGCFVTPPAGATSIWAALTSSVPKLLTFLTGGLPPAAGPCEGQSPHGFYGIETQAVDAIAAFIKTNSPLPVPMAPTALACHAAGSTVVSADWQLARPFGITLAANDATLLLQSAGFTAAVDVYFVIAVPGGQQWVVDAAKQLLPFPANIVPLRANSAAALTNVSPPFFTVPLTAIPPGDYVFYLLAVPAGTNPMSFSLASSPYYLWCFTRSF